MTRALVITGGNVADDVVVPEYDICIAADSGFDTARRLGIFPDVIIGDFDSVTDVPDEYTDPITGRKSEIIRYPAVKDESDTTIAAMTAAERGAETVYVIGGLSGRLDHTLSNIILLRNLIEKGVVGVITDGENEIRILPKSEFVRIPYGEYKYFGVFAKDAVVSLDGCAYPLDHVWLMEGDNYGISNEPLEGGAVVVCHDGMVFVTRSERIR